jgi:predicted amidohydrolase YtcJ
VGAGIGWFLQREAYLGGVAGDAGNDYSRAMIRTLAWLALAVPLILSCAGAPKCDRLFVGGVVHTPQGAIRTEIAVSQGRVLALVEPARAAAWRRSAASVVDLAGAHVYPGFTEAHGHYSGYGAALEQVDLVGTTSLEEVVARARVAAQAIPQGEWVLGRGWDQNDWPRPEFPTADLLSQAIPDHPVLLRRVDGHAVLVNAAALALAGITAATPDPPGGRILRDAGGRPTGVLVDAAADRIGSVLPHPTAQALERRYLLAGRRLASLGITEIHDAGVGRAELAVLRAMQSAGSLPVRVYAMLDGSDDELLATELAAGRSLSGDGMLAVRAVKLYADGALGSRGALLSDPYSDEPTKRGLELTDEAHLLELIRRIGEAGFQPCTHAIGDAAVKRTLSAYRLALDRGAGLRPRVEHAQIVRPEDVSRFAELGVIASVQPTHCTSDMPWAPARLGPERIAWAYRWHSLLAAGARLCLGSDVPVEDPDPRLGMWAAVTRRTPAGTPSEGWNLSEALDVSEAIAGYTTGAAYAAFEEAWRGAIAPAYAADLTVVDRDLGAVPPQEILRARILRTVVGGRDAFVAGGTT